MNPKGKTQSQHKLPDAKLGEGGREIIAVPQPTTELFAENVTVMLDGAGGKIQGIETMRLVFDSGNFAAIVTIPRAAAGQIAQLIVNTAKGETDKGLVLPDGVAASKFEVVGA